MRATALRVEVPLVRPLAPLPPLPLSLSLSSPLLLPLPLLCGTSASVAIRVAVAISLPGVVISCVYIVRATPWRADFMMLYSNLVAYMWAFHNCYAMSPVISTLMLEKHDVRAAIAKLAAQRQLSSPLIAWTGEAEAVGAPEGAATAAEQPSSIFAKTTALYVLLVLFLGLTVYGVTHDWTALPCLLGVPTTLIDPELSFRYWQEWLPAGFPSNLTVILDSTTCADVSMW